MNSLARFRVVVTDFIDEPLSIERELLGDIAEVVALNATSEEQIVGQLDDADALLVYHFVSLSGSLINRLRRCKIIVRCGAGFDNVDCQTARLQGIDVANVPDYGTEDVADTALAMALSLERGTHRLSRICQRETACWSYELAVPLRRVRGRVFGIVGLGRIGTATALRAKALGYDVVFYDPYVCDGQDKALGVRRMNHLSDLLRQSNVVSCHCLLSPETRHLIDSAAVELMPVGSILVNTARGAVVQPQAVLEGLESGRLAGAAIDVIDQEPPADDHPLLVAWRDPRHPAHDRLILTPHVAFYSEEGLADMRRKGCENVRRVLLGEPPRNVVN